MKTEHLERENWLKKRLLPWKPHRGILANVVAGAVEWRRILISLNDHPNLESRKAIAVENSIRLSLETAGNFYLVFRRRMFVGAVVFLNSVSLAWCYRTYLCTAQPPALYVAVLTVMTASAVYLLIMGYVAYIFDDIKKTVASKSHIDKGQPHASRSTSVHHPTSFESIKRWRWWQP